MAQSLHLFSLYYICKKMIRYIYIFIVLFCFNVSGQIDSGCVNKSYYMHANKTKGWRVLGLKSEYDVKVGYWKAKCNTIEDVKKSLTQHHRATVKKTQVVFFG